MKKRYLVLMLVAGLMVGSVAVYAAGKDGVAANVNGEKVLVSELKQGYDDNEQINTQLKFEEFYPKALDVFVNAKVVLQAAEANKIKETAEYKKQIALMQDELLRRIYIEKEALKRVKDSEVKGLYEEYKKGFQSKEEVKAKHILVDDEAKAKEVIVKLKKGENFEELAKQFSKDQVDLGYFTKDMMVKEFGDAAFSMKKGTYSQVPVKTQFGYHVIFAEDNRKTQPASFKEAEKELKMMVAQNNAAEIVKELRDKAKVEIYDLEGKKL